MYKVIFLALVGKKMTGNVHNKEMATISLRASKLE
jgi:hypothetical protein